jgi:tetratricopeptide (TPR) repeat protein
MPAFFFGTAMQPATLNSPPSPIEAEVQHIRALLEQNQFAPALAAAQALLVRVPENRDVLYMIAVSQRYLNRIPEALTTLARLEQLHPKFPRLFQERGHCHVALRSAGEAIEAFERAVNLNAALPASWKALQVLYRMTGRTVEADNAAGRVASLAALPREISTACNLFADGEIYDAERIVRRYLLTHGNHIEGMRLLAQIGMELDILDDAELLLESILVLAPDYHAARYEYAIALLKRHKHVLAREQMEILLKTDPDNRVYRATHATIFLSLAQPPDCETLLRDPVPRRRERPRRAAETSVRTLVRSPRTPVRTLTPTLLLRARNFTLVSLFAHDELKSAGIWSWK